MKFVQKFKSALLVLLILFHLAMTFIIVRLTLLLHPLLIPALFCVMFVTVVCVLVFSEMDIQKQKKDMI